MKLSFLIALITFRGEKLKHIQYYIKYKGVLEMCLIFLYVPTHISQWDIRLSNTHTWDLQKRRHGHIMDLYNAI